jgi:lipopolysaccharide/colanic/teichoic acid biosynthesis glycosyltransferase
MASRAFDIFLALLGLLLLLIALPIIALLIKFDSQGPIFYKCKRVGKDGKIFKMYKFRTMYETPIHLGSSVSPQGDPRVTPIGKILRRLKLNEFPQFINILKGDMTLVGPRPESPDLAAAYPANARPIFSVKPGLLGPNQILGRNEEESYPSGVNPTQYYIEEILPRKLPIDLEYIKKKSFLQDLRYLFLGAWVTITGAIGKRHLMDNISQICMLVSDSICCFLSFTMAFYIRFETFLPLHMNSDLWKILPLTVLTRIPLLLYLGTYRTLIRYFQLSDLKKAFWGVSLGSVGLVTISFFSSFRLAEYGRSVFVIDWLLLVVLLIVYRAILKTQHQNNKHRKGNHLESRRALIWGAGEEEGRWCLRYLKEIPNPRYEVIGFIDEDPKMCGRSVEGFKILGNHCQLEILVQLFKIQEIFFASPGVSESQMELVQEISNKFLITLMCYVPRTIKRIPSNSKWLEIAACQGNLTRSHFKTA